MQFYHSPTEFTNHPSTVIAAWPNTPPNPAPEQPGTLREQLWKVDVYCRLPADLPHEQRKAIAHRICCHHARRRAVR